MYKFQSFKLQVFYKFKFFSLTSFFISEERVWYELMCHDELFDFYMKFQSDPLPHPEKSSPHSTEKIFIFIEIGMYEYVAPKLQLASW